DARRAQPQNFLSMEIVRKTCRALPCHHLLVVLDCCFAGIFAQLSARHFMPAMEQALERERYDFFLQRRAFQLIASASHNEMALDNLTAKVQADYLDDSGHSPFARAFLEGLGPRKAADQNRDGMVTATELYVYIRQDFNTLFTHRPAAT